MLPHSNISLQIGIHVYFFIWKNTLRVFLLVYICLNGEIQYIVCYSILCLLDIFSNCSCRQCYRESNICRWCVSHGCAEGNTGNCDSWTEKVFDFYHFFHSMKFAFYNIKQNAITFYISAEYMYFKYKNVN